MTASLSTRQQHVARLVADGLSDMQIARDLGISSCTVKNHLYAIRIRLGLPMTMNARVLLARHIWELEMAEKARTDAETVYNSETNERTGALIGTASPALTPDPMTRKER